LTTLTAVRELNTNKWTGVAVAAR